MSIKDRKSMNEKKKILYLGKLYSPKLLRTIIEDSKGKISMSNHNFEMSLLNGLCLQNNIDLKCVIVPGVYSFPYNNKKFYTSSEHYKYKIADVHSVGFCNLPIIKEFLATIFSAWQIYKTIKYFDGDRVDVIMNTPTNSFFNALKLASCFVKKQITTTVIIPDIPSMVYSMTNHNFFKKMILKRKNTVVMDKTSNANGLVLLTEAMMDFISRPVKHMVMEGIVDVHAMDILSKNNTSFDKQIILYTGTLRRIFGVMNLVSAFQQIPNDNIELWICGSGDSKEAIEEAAYKDKRIKFFGLVDSRTALEMQHQATILVNPRTSEGEYTKYSFPSKTMEYLLAGKSVVINKLPGIPIEYYNYVYCPENESVPALVECVKYVLNLDKNIRDTRALAGRKFIIEQKNSAIQMSRIIRMIDTY